MAQPYKPYPKSRRDIAIVRRTNSANSAALQRKLGRLQALMGKNLPKAIAAANEEGLHDLQKLARRALAARLKESRNKLRTGNLQAAIMDDKYSIADARRVQLLRDELIRPDVPYYRAIEHGDRSQVGQKRPFEFLGGRGGSSTRGPRKLYDTQQPPRRDAAFSSATAERIVGARERFNRDRFGSHPRRASDTIISRRREKVVSGADNEGLYLVTIKNPVPAYHYARTAQREFTKGGYYNRALNRAIRSSGLDRAGIKFVITPKAKRQASSG